ncbi:MAG: hypothetical protein F4106_12860 [Gemmatimonadetes bacterium]|nr:hypothetical protein [Gemmatimonadota bacterium]MYG36922.1 hypothetical protein [Gemmatimonadota bacterium]MYJ18901.1 hypothetical protein [Gemmatimonadota bacterium]
MHPSILGRLVQADRIDGRPCERIDALARHDKWYLGGLDGVVWAPPFPKWLHRPGFWDPAHLLQHEVGPAFSVAILDRGGTEVALRGGPAALAGGGFAEARLRDWSWRPGHLIARWSTGLPAAGGVHRVEEDRRIRPGGILESCWRLPRALAGGQLVGFTAQPADAVSLLHRTERGVSWMRTVSDRSGMSMTVRMELRGPSAPARCQVIRSEGRAVPEWAHSPFAEVPALPDALASPAAAGDGHTGWIWIAVAFHIGAEGRVALQLQLQPQLGEPVGRPCPRPDADWASFFAGFPTFACGDPQLDRYFDYRVYGLGLNRIEGRWGNVRHPAIAEGPEYFHVPITYSAQCHMMEMRWRAGGREAWGSLLNFVDNQKPDGSFHGRLYPDHLEGTDFYHANWGDALLAVDDMHPSPVALVRCYEGLARYARWLDTARDPEQSGMFTVVNHFETGQEYMSRYMAVDDEADVAGWRPRLRLKGIDISVYAHQLFRALAVLAGRLGRTGDEAEWRALGDRCATAITERMWCPETRLFTDVDGRTLRRTGVKAAVGFYPMLAGLADGRRLDAMLDHLEDPSTFGTPFPLPSSSVDDPRFSAEGIWRGKRRNCPWNGRVWPMTTSHVIEGLLREWRRGNRRAGGLAADMLARFVRMMFTDGDPGRPNCFEHYNPCTGRACHFRGIDDYQHSWVLDLLARGFAGLHVDARVVELRPLPHGQPHVSMGPVTARGRALYVALDEERATLTVDGERYSGPRGEPLIVAWDDVAPTETPP